ncbi:MAG: alpha-L-fucosidase [Burkholderiales bacterium]|nr:alpha-L-fucosidase [Opitutaceae bacterium]
MPTVPAGSFPAATATATTLAAWSEARFGLFVHWGIYSWAGGEWKGSFTAEKGLWKGKGFTEFLQLQGQIPIAEYEDYARGFVPERFDADEWARIARAAGMRYLVFTTKHHEGFAMYRSATSSFNIADHTRFGRDPVAELAAACARHDLQLGLYYSLGRDWHDPDTPTDWPTKGGRSNTWDFPDEDGKVFDRYFRRKALPQVRELLTNYGPVAILWFDTPERITPEQSRELMTLVRELQPGCIVNDRVGNRLGDFETFEQKVPEAIVTEPWEACATLGKNWSYHQRDLVWKSPEQIVRLLTDVVAKNGNLLFNVGPRGDGSFPPGSSEHLAEVGAWLAVNGPAIYGSSPWHVFGESFAVETNAGASSPSPAPATDTDTVHDKISRSLTPDLRYTVGADGALYLIARSWPAGELVARELGSSRPNIGRIAKVGLLGRDEPVTWEQREQGLAVGLPACRPGAIPVQVLRIEWAP